MPYNTAGFIGTSSLAAVAISRSLIGLAETGAAQQLLPDNPFKQIDTLLDAGLCNGQRN